jgi:hypothetical protein
MKKLMTSIYAVNTKEEFAAAMQDFQGPHHPVVESQIEFPRIDYPMVVTFVRSETRPNASSWTAVGWPSFRDKVSEFLREQPRPKRPPAQE